MFEVLTTVTVTVFCDVTPCTFLNIYQAFRRTIMMPLSGKESHIFEAQLIGAPRNFSFGVGSD